MDEGVTDSNTPNVGWGVAVKPQTRVSGKKRATTRNKIVHRADRAGGKKLLFLAVPIIEPLIKPLIKKNTSANYSFARDGHPINICFSDSLPDAYSQAA